jgi:nucleotide-binding universal stress UspA family protein
MNTPQPSQDEIDDSYRSSITAVFEQVSPRPDWQLGFARGDAGPVLVREAKDAQLLVVGTREHVGLGRLLVGSISHYCLTHATCPVVAVPAETT